MCKEKKSYKCCIDNLLLFLIIVVFMLLYIYLTVKNTGLIAIIIILTIFSLLLFSIRLEECGCPEWIKKCKLICKDYILGEQNSDETNENNS